MSDGFASSDEWKAVLPPRRYHFISGLPRSGSTLLSAILRQNPRFSAGMSSPVASLFEGVLTQVSAGSEIAPLVDQATRRRILKGLFDSYYAENPAPVVFDTNRAWTSKLPALMSLYPDAKLICCVRNVAWIMDSLERQFRQNAFENTRLFSSQAERSTVYTRVEALAHANRLVGFPWHALKEAVWSEYADRLVIVDYDLLTKRPADVIALIYGFLGEAPFAHDFENVEYDHKAFDAELGIAGLHKVRPKVEPTVRKTILPPDLFQRYANLAFWQKMPGSQAYKIVERTPESEAQQETMPTPTQPTESKSAQPAG
jgi:sulfotransferase